MKIKSAFDQNLSIKLKMKPRLGWEPRNIFTAEDLFYEKVLREFNEKLFKIPTPDLFSEKNKH